MLSVAVSVVICDSVCVPHACLPFVVVVVVVAVSRIKSKEAKTVCFESATAQHPQLASRDPSHDQSRPQL